MRDWNRRSNDVQAAGIRLLIVTSEDLERTRAAVAEKKLQDAPLITVPVETWTQWDVVNPKRPELPRPTTWVVAPDGEVVWSKTTAEYSDRIGVSRVLRVVERHRAGAPFPQEVQLVSEALDFEAALTVRAERVGRWVRLHVGIAEGWHSYGAREHDARPLWVGIDGQPVRARIPRQAELRGPTRVSVKTASDSGVLGYQVCSAGTCSPPLEVDWTVP